MDPADLEREIHRELRALPPPTAPATLLPRVMAAVRQAPAAPWYTRAWRTWPAVWQAASLVVLLAVAGGVIAAAPYIRTALETVPLVSAMRSEVSESARTVETTVTTIQVLWRTLVAPVVPYAFGLVMLMSAACALFGTVLNHLVFGKALR